MSAACCVDVGSTWTKAALVDLADGALLGTAAHPTTSATDVLHGVDACVAELGARGAPLLLCSSAGGGLRLGVVGYERVVTAEAGHRVGLTAGARVVHVAAGRLDPAAVRALRADRPDLLLLVGGTDGGNAEVLLHNAARLARSRWRRPVVVAGNAAAADEVLGVLRAGGVPAEAVANVLPEIGTLEPAPARAAIRGAFLRHVIGGKGLSRGPRFARLVRAATPDAVLTGVEVLAGLAGPVLVVDVGGATTDVFSVVGPDEEHASDAPARREVVEQPPAARTVEGDLGLRWSAPGVVDAAAAERLLGPADDGLAAAAAARHDDPGLLPADPEGARVDARLAELAVTVALRRHARAGARDLWRVRLVVGSGGVLRHGDDALRRQVLAPATGDLAGGWRLPEGARTLVDARYVLAAAGLLAAEHPAAARGLLEAGLLGR
ncbi:glutamate mutase L [Vallicoccus soli]|uniref:Glutamate mutase n=1 Tax=Vallicoccus soli TaxID=2339232 RepID=A0A3A3Z268_9ACTN|nr:glutamate mutase L [Vallicoccus soli]RJK98389.1 glutamate mutase [Vallicoccus soli]